MNIAKHTAKTIIIRCAMFKTNHGCKIYGYLILTRIRIPVKGRPLWGKPPFFRWRNPVRYGIMASMQSLDAAAFSCGGFAPHPLFAEPKTPGPARFSIAQRQRKALTPRRFCAAAIFPFFLLVPLFHARMRAVCGPISFFTYFSSAIQDWNNRKEPL